MGYETGFYSVAVYPGEKTKLTLRMIKRGMIITLRGIQFDFNKATIKKVSYPILDDAAAILTNYPEVSVEIQGHTCSLGKDVYNQKLSEARANSVRDYLIRVHMIESSRLNATGYGEAIPVASNKTEEEREKNRRVDFLILE
jgi:outer membrane protein OmpA-like peptidoglycan-associated protein